MTNYKEIIRLHSLGLNKTRIAESCGCARSTVITALHKAEENGLSWNAVKNLSSEEVTRKLYQIPKLHNLTRRITELTEEIEELKTEKEMLLRSLDCADDAGISDVKKEIATLEGALKKLSEQEEKYSAELDEALKQYAELKEQAAGMDAADLMDARLVVREEKERSAIDKVKAAYGEKYDPMMMHDSKRDVADLLHEEAEVRSVREFLRHEQQQQVQQKQNKKRQLGALKFQRECILTDALLLFCVNS